MTRATTADVGLDVDVATLHGARLRPRRRQRRVVRPGNDAGRLDGDRRDRHRAGLAFDDPGDHGNLTGGDGGFAIVDSDTTARQRRPGHLAGLADVRPHAGRRARCWSSPAIQGQLLERADVDVSVDGGTTWTNVWRATDNVRGPGPGPVPLPTAAGQADVQVRFHYFRAGQDWWWQVDDVFVGEPTCEPGSGGLVVGRTVSTRGKALNGARVASDDRPTDDATSVPTPADPRKGDGFYWLFSSLLGRVDLTASAPDHSPRTTGSASRPTRSSSTTSS